MQIFKLPQKALLKKTETEQYYNCLSFVDYLSYHIEVLITRFKLIITGKLFLSSNYIYFDMLGMLRASLKWIMFYATFTHFMIFFSHFSRFQRFCFYQSINQRLISFCSITAGLVTRYD